MELEYTAYHGTSARAGDEILSSRQFYKSSRDSEWAGTGVYFFVEDDPYSNALRWAKYIKNFSDPVVLRARVVLGEGRLLDLTQPEAQSWFHRVRELLFRRARELAEENGKQIDDAVLKKLCLDCRAINELCGRLGYEAVKRRCYIRFRLRGRWRDYPGSDIPNCTILCVREHARIQTIERGSEQ